MIYKVLSLDISQIFTLKIWFNYLSEFLYKSLNLTFTHPDISIPDFSSECCQIKFQVVS
jgi:hypothetical protein